MAIQPDRKILVGGRFYTLGGQYRDRIGRLNPDGTLDTAFDSWADSWLNSIAVQADGKILVGGDFATLGDEDRSRIGRLNLDGTLDTAFNPEAFDTLGRGWVSSLVLQADGKILVGGMFTMLGGQARTNLGRLNPDGTLDTTFKAGTGDYKTFNAASVSSLALQADGKIVVGGYFTNLCGQARNRIGRLNPDGTLDTTFHPEIGGYPYQVYSLAVQADGKILVGGMFTNLCGQACNYLGRLNPDGTLDIAFNPEAKNSQSYVTSLALQADGKILVGGAFTNLCGQACNYLGRLNPDGTLDTAFNPAVNGEARSLSLQADGKILVGGWFSLLGGQPRNYLGRLNNTDPATQSLAYDGANVTWLRGGASPEVSYAVFDWSADGLSWTNLGVGARISGGWRQTGVALPTNAILRARGWVTGGQYNGSTWFVESRITNAPAPVVPPVLAVQSLSAQVLHLQVTGATNATCTIQTTPQLAPSATWQPALSLTLTNGQGGFNWTNAGEARVFFRAVQP